MPPTGYYKDAKGQWRKPNGTLANSEKQIGQGNKQKGGYKDSNGNEISKGFTATDRIREYEKKYGSIKSKPLRDVAPDFGFGKQTGNGDFTNAILKYAVPFIHHKGSGKVLIGGAKKDKKDAEKLLKLEMELKKKKEDKAKKQKEVLNTENKIVKFVKDIGPARNGQVLLRALNLHNTDLGRKVDRVLEVGKQLGFGDIQKTKKSTNRPKNFNNRIY
jgi:hypothetical protein